MFFEALTRWGTIHLGVEYSMVVNDGQWHHYAMTVESGAKLQAFVDGLLVGDDTRRFGFMTNGKSDVLIGKRSNGYPVEAEIAHLRIYDRILSESDIRVQASFVDDFFNFVDAIDTDEMRIHNAEFIPYPDPGTDPRNIFGSQGVGLYDEREVVFDMAATEPGAYMMEPEGAAAFDRRSQHNGDPHYLRTMEVYIGDSATPDVVLGDDEDYEWENIAFCVYIDESDIVDGAVTITLKGTSESAYAYVQACSLTYRPEDCGNDDPKG